MSAAISGCYDLMVSVFFLIFYQKKLAFVMKCRISVHMLNEKTYGTNFELRLEFINWESGSVYIRFEEVRAFSLKSAIELATKLFLIDCPELKGVECRHFKILN